MVVVVVTVAGPAALAASVAVALALSSWASVRLASVRSASVRLASVRLASVRLASAGSALASWLVGLAASPPPQAGLRASRHGSSPHAGASPRVRHTARRRYQVVVACAPAEL